MLSIMRCAVCDGDFGFVQRGLLDGDAGFGVGLLVDHVLLGLMKPVLGGLHSEIVLLCDDGGQQRIAADFELGEFEIGLGGFELVAGFLLRCLAGRLGLDDLLLGFELIGLRFAEIEFLLGGIELDDDVAGIHQFARIAERHDGHGVDARHGRDEHFGVAALQFAAGGNGDGDASALDARGGDLGTGGGSGGDELWKRAAHPSRPLRRRRWRRA